MTTPSKIIPSNFLFRFRFLCRRWDAPSPRAVDPETLDASFRIPLWSFIPKSEARLERQTQQPVETVGRDEQLAETFDFRIGWSPDGLILTVVVAGKDGQPFWQRSALNSADSLRICLDTRDMNDMHRGTRFCYKFVFFPLIGESARSARRQLHGARLSPLGDLDGERSSHWKTVQSSKFADEGRSNAFTTSSGRRKNGKTSGIFIR